MNLSEKGVLSTLLDEEDGEKVNRLLAYLQSEKVLTVAALVKLLESEPNDEDLLAFGLEDKKAWASLKDSIVSQVGKKLNLAIVKEWYN